MSRELTNLECLLIMALCLTGAVLSTGCATRRAPPLVETCSSFTVITCSQEYIASVYKGDKDPRSVMALTIPQVRMILVTDSGFDDLNGMSLPMQDFLGHEVLHLMRGRWHK